MPTKETMTPRERWLAVLQRKKPDRLPMDYWATTEVTEMLMKHCRCPDELSLFKKLNIDKSFKVSPEYVGPELTAGVDEFGCQYKKADYGSGVYDECLTHPLSQYQTVDEIKKNYSWPKADWWDCSMLSEQIKGQEDYPIQGGGSEPFMRYKDLRGGEQAFIDLIENPEVAHYCLTQLYDLAYEKTVRIYESIPGKILLGYVAEDMGAQSGLMFSPKQIKEFFIPHMKKMIDFIHQNKAFVFHHNDGAIRAIIPAMIEAGIDVLNPIQWRCSGMDRAGLKKDFGGQLIFHGGVDNQHTLPFATIEEVKQEVLDNIKILGQNGGYILAPCHNIQPNTPPENIVAMYETGYQYG